MMWGRGGCVCVCGGVGINILYPWKSTDEYAISLLYISCNIYICVFVRLRQRFGILIPSIKVAIHGQKQAITRQVQLV